MFVLTSKCPDCDRGDEFVSSYAQGSAWTTSSAEAALKFPTRDEAQRAADILGKPWRVTEV